MCPVSLPASPGAGSRRSSWLTFSCNLSKGKRMEEAKGKKTLNFTLQLIINRMWFPSISRVFPWSPQDCALAGWIRNKLFSFSLFYHIFSPFHHRTPSFFSLILPSSAPIFQSLFRVSPLPSSPLLHTGFSHILSLIALQQQCPDTEKNHLFL